jgi:microsomal prostaglandin-E synthase 2
VCVLPVAPNNDIAKRGITDERAALQSALETFQRSGLGRNDFVSGQADPNLGDLAVYGILRSVEGLKAHNNVMNDPDNVALNEWYLRVKERLIPY